MIPVLAVRNVAAACRKLQSHFGFQPLSEGRMRFGAAHIVVATYDQLPADMIEIPLDHIAFQVPQIDSLLDQFLASGALLDRRFTPDGPRTIDEFWENGVRFFFCPGPEHAPFEFCERLGSEHRLEAGHGHFAIRTNDLAQFERRIVDMGGERIAQYSLAGNPEPVPDRFLQAGSVVFELFDEPGPPITDPELGWVGLMRD